MCERDELPLNVPEQAGEVQKKKKKRSKPIDILIAILLFGLLCMINLKEMRDEKREHPPEEIALYLEQCWGLPVTVSYNTFSSFADSRYAGQIPYIAETVLEDGSALRFYVGLDRAYPYMEGGLYTDFEEEMLSHYASVYGIASKADRYCFALYPAREQTEGEEPALKRLLDTLMASSYIQCGQEIELYIYPTESWNETVTLKWEEPIDYDALSKKLTELAERWGEN